ncbi:MAG: tRNA uridine-5-carboxymethylaminomethyl(34) synthesis GTPase MnmE [Syntrophobacterales bacterium]|jgi:tRNA modification GTPase|nr:tRNA uridine-5-carboxymethylaminomethyl(34) synthesis GTPase MnmE [Syntrophobacterales bacterium]
MENIETICAVSTPSGEGGIGIVRLSGPDAHKVLKAIFRKAKGGGDITSRRMYLGHIVDPEHSEQIDEVFAVFMNAPLTYTREDIGEVYSHGGLAVQRRILSVMIRCGARLAEPGEFTKRAFLNGRIDLAQAEAVLDIIESETDEELGHAIKSLEGVLSKKINGIRNQLRRALVEVEALIDFPEEEIDVDEKEVLAGVECAEKEIAALADSYYEGNAVKHGLEVLIVGRTNVGKSSLLNALLARERAIVTPLPGTTRDMIEDTIHIMGIKVRIVDTAGFGLPRDIVEREGLARVKRKIPEADLILWVVDGSRPYSDEDREVCEEIGKRRKIVVINKTDLPRLLEIDIPPESPISGIEVSALREEGIEALKTAIYEALMSKERRANAILVTNLRHKDALSRALTAARNAVSGLKRQEPAEFIAFDLRDAGQCLGEITGEAWTDDILHDIFSRFCIGK